MHGGLLVIVNCHLSLCMWLLSSNNYDLIKIFKLKFGKHFSFVHSLPTLSGYVIAIGDFVFCHFPHITANSWILEEGTQYPGEPPTHPRSLATLSCLELDSSPVSCERQGAGRRNILDDSAIGAGMAISEKFRGDFGLITIRTANV